MSVTDELHANAERYAEGFDKGDLPLPPGKQVAVVAYMDARLNPYGLLGLSEGDAHVIRNAETGLKPDWSAEAFSDLDADVRQPLQRIAADPLIPVKDSVPRIRLRGRDRTAARGQELTVTTTPPRQ
ncbi:hypothetical protein ACFPJ1_16590 [Kribbella qitaiheensis]|uniref:hypothetical protein n=1 Tax=Kribbella qitaiheensis TaxID=1544730 RepID=UPI0036097A25